MRRLPIFFLLDVSESMVGDNIRQMYGGLERLVTNLRSDPHALESVYLATIVFAGKAKVLMPLVELMNFYPPRLPVGSGTSLGAGLNTLMDEIDRQIVKSTADVKGDWKPIVYLMTDGKPTDEVQLAIERWKRGYQSKASMVAIGIGPYASLDVLSKLTENAFQLRNETADEFASFIRWLSQSVSSQSRSVTAAESSGVSLAKIDESVLKKIENIAQAATLDEDFVILTGRCETTRLPYVMRYGRAKEGLAQARRRGAPADSYELEGVFALEKDYLDLSDDRAMAKTVNSQSLIGAPGCPHCGASIALAVCACGGVHCLKSDEATCPWCEKRAFYAATGEEGLNVTRSRG